MSRGVIRDARAGEAGALTALAMRSKAHWGYDAGFMARVAPILTVTEDYVRRNPVFVADVGGTPVGFCSLVDHGDELELDLMFVEPSMIRAGIGRALLERALIAAAATPHARVIVESDPDAEGFYAAFGARRIGHRDSGVIAGRQLPLLAFDLPAFPGRVSGNDS